jgi:outer membrane protein assembly factor BamE
MLFLRSIKFAVVASLLGGCGVIYKVDVNQGNLIEPRMVESLKPGMTKRQVSLVMGTPSIQTPFDVDRWDYAASISRRGATPEIKNLTLVFDDNLLVRIEGDYFGKQDAQLLDDAVRLRGRAIDPLEDASDESKARKKPSGG